MKKTGRYTHRVEIRTDAPSVKKLSKFCKDMGQSKSEILRDALNQYIELGPLKEILIAAMKEPRFRGYFKNFLKLSPDSISQFFEDFIGSYEEELAKQLSFFSGNEDFFLTERGKKAFLKAHQ